MEIQCRLKNKISGKFPDFGAIFMSNASTKEESFKRKIFGLPMSFAYFVEGVKAGMILFLFEFEKRELYGVFKATTDGQLNIIPYAYSSSGKKFPAQVRFTTIWHCHPLREHEFQEAIRDNYFATRRFTFGLSKDQVQRLLWLFDSRKIRLSQSRSFTDSEARKRHLESSEQRETEKDWSNPTKIAGKKLKWDIDSVSHSNAEPLAYSGKLTVAKDGSQLLDSGDLHVACKESDSMHCNFSYCPDGPSSQRSLAVVAGHSSTSGQELGPHPDHAIQSQPVSIREELKELETGGNLDNDLGDYIPLLPSDDSDSDTKASPESRCFMKDHLGLLFSVSGLFEEICQPVFAASPITKVSDVHIRENACRLKSPVDNCQEHEDSDYIRLHASVKGLYSDASNNRSSVFSRLNFSSRAQDKKDDTRAEKSVHRTRKQQKCSTRVDKSAQEIMEELQQVHNKRRRMLGMTRSIQRQNEHSAHNKTSAFLCSMRTSVPGVQDNDISTRWQERKDKQRNMRETIYPVPGGKKTSVLLRLGKTSERDVHDTGISTLLQGKHVKQRKIGETECLVNSYCLSGENEEMGKSLILTDSDGVELDGNISLNNASPAVTRLLKTEKHHHFALNENVMRLTMDLMEMQDAENRMN